MPNLIDIKGQRFGRLVVISHVEKSIWECHCDCGTVIRAWSQNLRRGRSSSCGCYKREQLSITKKGNKNGYKHGHAAASGVSPEYTCWAKMKDRCTNPNNPEYKNYGARGITVCPRWMESFANFLEDMGFRPDPKLSIDRIDNNGNYEPSNVRWATKSQQNANRRPYKRRR